MTGQAIHSDTQFEISTLTQTTPPATFAQLRNELAVLLDDRHENAWRLGRVLCALRDAGYAEGSFGGHLTLESYVTHNHGFSYRTAQRLMTTFVYLDSAGVDEATVAEIGSWTKLALIGQYKPDDLPHWLKLAKALSRRKHEDALKETSLKSPPNAKGAVGDTADPVIPDDDSEPNEESQTSSDDFAAATDVSTSTTTETAAAFASAIKALIDAVCILETYALLAAKSAKTQDAKDAAERALERTYGAIEALYESRDAET